MGFTNVKSIGVRSKLQNLISINANCTSNPEKLDPKHRIKELVAKNVTLIQKSGTYGKNLSERSKLLMLRQQLWQVLITKKKSDQKNTPHRSKPTHRNTAKIQFKKQKILLASRIRTSAKQEFKNYEFWLYLSTSRVLLICGDTDLAGEKFGLYPDMAITEHRLGYRNEWCNERVPSVLGFSRSSSWRKKKTKENERERETEGTLVKGLNKKGREESKRVCEIWKRKQKSLFWLLEI